MIALKEANYLGRVERLRQEKGLIASITSYPDTGYAESLHYHDTLHLSLIIRGGNLEKRKQQSIERLPGVVTFYDPGEPHQSRSTLPGSRHVNLEITKVFLEQFQVRANASALEKIRSPDARFLLLKIIREMLLNDRDSALGITSLTLHLLQLSALPDRFSKEPKWVLAIDELLHDRWDEKLTLHDLSAAAQLHPAHLSGYFPHYFGCTIGEYRRKLKVEKALSYLDTDACSMTQIAYLCGFADQSHFIRIFKQQTGWSPRQLRQILS